MLCVQWHDNLTSWEKLSDLKESYPVNVAEYVVTVGIADQPTFSWWVAHVLKKQDWIIAAVSSGMIKRMHKFGIKVPWTVKEALQFDKENGDTQWLDAIVKEMKAIHIAFKILKDGKNHFPPHSLCIAI